METEKQGSIKLQTKIKVFEILAELSLSQKNIKFNITPKYLNHKWRLTKTIW